MTFSVFDRLKLEALRQLDRTSIIPLPHCNSIIEITNEHRFDARIVYDDDLPGKKIIFSSIRDYGEYGITIMIRQGSATLKLPWKDVASIRQGPVTVSRK